MTMLTHARPAVCPTWCSEHPGDSDGTRYHRSAYVDLPSYDDLRLGACVVERPDGHAESVVVTVDAGFVELSPEQLRELARELLAFADKIDAA